MSTAVTASVWGQGLAAIRLSAQVASRGMAEGDEECHICRDDIPATIAFVPCKHKVCFGCMENMRAKNIFKADKGIKCPFCRQYVDGYQSVHPPTPDIHKFLSEANKAAAVAAAARAAAERKAAGLQQQQYGGGGGGGAAGGGVGRAAAGAGSSSSSGTNANNAAGAAATPSAIPGFSATAEGDLVWNCGSCGERNFFWREFCGRCKRPCANPYGSDKLSQTRKDLGHVTHEELLAYLHDQGGYCLRKPLKDIGVSLDNQRCYGSPPCMRQAVAQYGVKRVLHLADLLSDPATIQTASLHHMGNLGVQRLLEGSAKLRSAYGPGSGKPQHPDIETYMRKHGGKDPFGSMLAAIIPRMLQFCLHDKGVYVLQGAAAVASNAELVAMAQAVFPLTLVASRDPRGVFVLLTLLDLLSARIWDDGVNCEPALKAIDLLCQQYTLSDKQMVHNAMHALSGKVMVRAIAISMPRFPALKLAIKIACHASVLWPTTGGQFTLNELLQLYGHNQEAAEGLRDVVTCMCYSTQGQIGRMALGTDSNVHELLLSLVERLGHEQETEWLDSLVQEMVGVVDQLLGQTGIEILKFTLTQPCLDLDTVSHHIKDMKALLTKPQLLPIVIDLQERMGSNPPPPAPKYPAASVVQPELRYFLSIGYNTPLPPPPPPRPGEEGYEAYLAAAAARAEAQAAAAAEARAARDAESAAWREANAAANGGGSRNNAVIDAWSRLQAGAEGGGGGAGAGSSSNPWQASSSSTSAATPAVDAAGGGDVWGGGGGAGGGSNDPWAGVTGGSSSVAAPAPAADAWGAAPGASASPAPAAAAVPSRPPPMAPVAMPVAAPVVAPIAAPVAVPVAAPIAAPIAVPIAAPVTAAIASAQQPQQQHARAAGGGGGIAGRPPSAQQQHQPQVPQYQQQQRQSPQDMAWPAPQQAAQFAASGSNRSRTPSHQLAPQQQQPMPPPRRPHSAPLRQQQQQQLQQWEEPAAAVAAQPAAAAAVTEGPWACGVCTYEHTGGECKFLSCAMCGTPKA